MDFHTHTVEDTRWELRPEWESVLLGPDGLRLEEWIDAGQAQLVKSGDQRAIYRIDVPQGSLYLKHYRCESWRTAARNLFRASASRREWLRTLEVLRRQLPTATPVAIGENFRHGVVHDSYFIAEAIPDTFTLDDFLDRVLPALPAAEQPRVRRELVLGLARLCARLHRLGVEHLDFHGGNLLVRFVPDAPRRGAADYEPHLYLIDLPKVRLSAPLNWPRSRRGLVSLTAGLYGRSTRADRWRFWQEYVRERPDLALSGSRDEAADILRRALAHARRNLRRRDKRCLGDNKDFYAASLREGRGHAVRDVPREQLIELLRDPESLIRRYCHFPEKISHTSVVVQAELRARGRNVRAAYKRSRLRSRWKGWFRWLRPSRSLRCWRLGHALLARGIATPRPLLVVEPRRGLDSYLATAWIPNATNLHVFLWKLAEAPPRERARKAQRLAESLGSLLGEMHAWQIAHRDLKGGNFAVSEPVDLCSAVAVAEGDVPSVDRDPIKRAEKNLRPLQCYVLDLDGVVIRRRLTESERAQNLARLAVSIEMHPWVSHGFRLRFLQAYLRRAPLEGKSWKDLWLEIAQRAERIIAHMRKEGRPLA